MDKVFFISSHGIIPLGLLTQADKYIQVNMNFMKSKNKNQCITSEEKKGLQENDTDTECSPFLTSFPWGKTQSIFFSSKYYMQVKSKLN